MSKKNIYSILSRVCDPEIPVLTIEDLGIIREVIFPKDGGVEVVITPTYSGCPAMDMIEVDIKAVLQEAGISPVKVTSVLHPAWTTAWLSEEGRRKLKEYGIAPPAKENPDKTALFQKAPKVACPHCSSMDTGMVSPFGSTPCKALYRCDACLEPFDYFKCH